MMKTSFIIFCILVTTNAWASSGGNIGLLDNRIYGSLQDPLYSAVGRIITSHKWTCTAGFIAPNLVITNRHCMDDCDQITTCRINFWNGNQYVETQFTKVVAMPKNHTTMGGDDWAILQTAESNPNFKKLASNSSVGPVDRGGFGGMRVIADSEVPELKRIFAETEEKYKTECTKEAKQPGKDFPSCVFKYFDIEIRRRGYQSVLGDSKNFKIQKCNIQGTHARSNKMVATDCDSAGGDSGTPLLRGDFIVALNNSGPHTFTAKDESIGATAVKNENFYFAAQQAISKAQHDAQITQLVNHINENRINNQPTPPNKPAINGNIPALHVTPPTQPLFTISTTNNEPVSTDVPDKPTNEEPVNNGVVTDPVQIQQIMQQTIMSMDCD